jgi:hypothetical protein
MLFKELMALECHQVQYKPDNVVANAYRLMKLLKDVIVSKFLGKFYLVDVGYAVRPGFLPPYRATRYHLREFGANRPQNQKELFNLRRSSLRVTIERAFEALKNRFRILDNKPFHPYRTQVKLVLACCILHNWILRHGQDELVPDEHS